VDTHGSQGLKESLELALIAKTPSGIFPGKRRNRRINKEKKNEQR